jgi:outer membrane protein
MLGLTQLLNLDSLPNFSIEKPVVEITGNDVASISVQNIYETALKNQHSIKAAQYNMISANKSLDVAKGKFSPTLSATGSLGTGTSELNKRIDAVKFVGVEQTQYVTSGGDFVYQPKTEIVTSKTPFADQFKDNVNKSIGFTLSVPIFNGLQTYTSYKNAQINALSVSYSRDLVEQNLYKTIAQAYANARAALNKYNANKLSVEANEVSFNFAQQKYNVGSLSSFDYNSAKTRLQTALGNLIQAKYDYVFKLKVLGYYQGKPITF